MKNKEKQLAILQQLESYLEDCKESIEQENDYLPYFNNMGICVLKLIQLQGGIEEVKGFRNNIDILIN
jgi:hypothetical protein